MIKESLPPSSLDSSDFTQESLTFFDKANLGVFRMSPGGKCIRANSYLLRLTGCKSEKELLNFLQDRLASEWYVDPQDFYTFSSLLTQQGSVNHFETEIYLKNKTECIWISKNVWMVKDQQGEILFYEGTIEDITERKQNLIFQENFTLCVKDILHSRHDENLYQSLLEKAVAAVPGAQAGSILIQKEDRNYYFTAAVGFDLPALKEIPLPAKDLLVFDLESNQPHIIRHFHAYENQNATVQHTLETAGRVKDIKVSLCIPIFYNQQRALLYLDNFESPDAFSDTAQNMAGVFANQIAAILNRLNLESNLNLRQKNLQNWNHFHRNLNHFVSETLRYGLNESFYQRLLEHAKAVIPGVHAGSIMVRKQDGLYHYVAALGYNLEILKDVTYEDNEIIISSSLQPVIVNNLQDLNTFTLDPDKRERLYSSGPLHQIKSMMSLPALVEGSVVATLSLDTFEDHGFTTESQEMAKSFAAQIGVLLTRLTLEQKLEDSNEKLLKLANYDSLTGLPNRILFTDRLDESLAQAKRANSQVALLFFDLDGFKDVNDTFGHTIGDDLVKAVGERLSKNLRKEDTLARLGGDEFAVILHSFRQPEDTAKVAQKILDLLTNPFDLQGYAIRVGASLGISLYPDNGHTVEDLLKHADSAMYQAKQSGKNRFCYFTPELNQQMMELLKLESDMRRGLERNEFFLHYQPRVDLRSRATHSVEALLRWKHPTKGLIPPNHFIPLAEKTGLIIPLTTYVLNQAAAQAKLWEAQGNAVRVAVNLSAKCLQHSSLLSMVQNVLETHHLAAKYLELEITESTAMDDVENNIKTLNKLKEAGIYLAVDDFGTAYSSLNYLKRLPVRCLKVDRSFVKDISLDNLDTPDVAIVKAIVALGKALGFHLVAEGVETLDQVEFLRSLGCDEAQGYYFYKPLPPEDLFKSYLLP